jgi:glycosyltransferase involved in cell wall biosynthesis
VKRSGPRLSVVIPAFNAAQTLGSAIRSVLSQTDPGFELIVVDDGSTDTTPSVVRGHPDPRIRLVSQKNKGLPAARNAGILAARGEFVSFLDADDLWLPHYLERMYRALAVPRQAGLAYCDAWVFQDGTGRVRRSTVFDRHRPAGTLPADPAEFLLHHLRDNFFYVGATVRADVLEQVGGFREDMVSLEDYEMWLRIEAGGFGAVEVAEPLALYRTSANQMSADTLRMTASLVKLCEILESRDDLSPPAYRVLARRRQVALAEYRAATEPSRSTIVRVGMPRLASRILHGLPGGGIWRRRPPAVVAEVFPDLRRL